MKKLGRKSLDLWSIIIGSLLLIGAALVFPDTVLPIILGIPFLIFLPGYAILVVLFPARKDLNILERSAISFGVSLAIVPVVGIGLNLFEVGAKLSLILEIISVIAPVRPNRAVREAKGRGGYFRGRRGGGVGPGHLICPKGRKGPKGTERGAGDRARRIVAGAGLRGLQPGPG